MREEREKEERTHPRKNTVFSNKSERIKPVHEGDNGCTRRGKKEEDLYTPGLQAFRNVRFLQKEEDNYIKFHGLSIVPSKYMSVCVLYVCNMCNIC